MSECLEHLKTMMELSPYNGDGECVFCCREQPEHSEGCPYLGVQVYLSRLNMPVNTNPLRPGRPTVEARLDELELRLGEIVHRVNNPGSYHVGGRD